MSAPDFLAHPRQFFGTLFRRSGNLWIVAIIHGIGNAYIVGSLGAAR